MHDSKENNDVEVVICDTQDTQRGTTCSDDVSVPVQPQPKVASRRRKDQGNFHAPRHSILSRALLEGLAQRGENTRQLKQLERKVREELQPRGVIGDLLMDRAWSAYLRCVFIARTEARILTSDGPPADLSSLIPGLPKLPKPAFNLDDMSLSRLQQLAIVERCDARFSQEFFRAVGLLIAMRDDGGVGLTKQLEKTVGKNKDLEELRTIDTSTSDPEP